MAYNSAFRTAVQLTGAAQAAAQAFEDQMPLNQWLPAHQNPTLAYSFNAASSTDVDVAEYRAFDTPAPYGAVGSKITKSGQLPPISRKLPVSEYRELQYANQMGMLGTVMEDYAARLGVGIAARLEIARVQAVTTGKVVLEENGVAATVDFGRDASLTIPLLSATNRWSAAGGTPVDNLLAWINLVATASKGTRPTTMLTSAAVMNALATNPQVIAFALARTDSLPGRVSNDQVRAVLSGYANITSVLVADDAYSTYNFGQTVFPTDTVVLLPPPNAVTVDGVGSLGTTDYGVTAEAIQPEYGIPAGERSGIVGVAFDHHDPEGIDVLVSAVALPLLQRANTTLAAKVISV